MKISRINTHTNLITNKNNFHNNLNVVGTSSSSKGNQVSFNGAILLKAKKIVKKIFTSKKHIIAEVEAKDIQQLKKIQTAEPSATSKLKNNTEPIKWEIRENINDQTFNLDKENKEDTTDKNTKKQTNLLNLYA
jgi:tyrosyl-tRNA synthetase